MKLDSLFLVFHYFGVVLAKEAFSMVLKGFFRIEVAESKSFLFTAYFEIAGCFYLYINSFIAT